MNVVHPPLLPLKEALKPLLNQGVPTLILIIPLHCSWCLISLLSLDTVIGWLFWVLLRLIVNLVKGRLGTIKVQLQLEFWELHMDQGLYSQRFLELYVFLEVFLRMAFILRIFLRIWNCYMHKTLILDTRIASKYRKSLLGLYSQRFLLWITLSLTCAHISFYFYS